MRKILGVHFGRHREPDDAVHWAIGILVLVAFTAVAAAAMWGAHLLLARLH